MRGWIQGYPKKLASAANAASVPLANSSRLAACASAHGQLLAHATVTLRQKADHLAGLLDRSIVARRYFPRLSAGMHNKPIVDELVRCISDDILITNIWIGEGELVFPEAWGEELEILGPLRVGRGFRFSFSYSVNDIEILADLTV
jgi:Acetoacetate decarboxylase (ADC).